MVGCGERQFNFYSFEGQRHKPQIRRVGSVEAELNRGPSAYQPQHITVGPNWLMPGVVSLTLLYNKMGTSVETLKQGLTLRYTQDT